MAYVIAQLSDIHIGSTTSDSGQRFSAALAEIQAMSRRPDLVLLTGDVTEHGLAEEWDELCRRLEVLDMPWQAIAGNHDGGLAALAGHRAVDAGPLRLVLVDSANEVFGRDDAAWLHDELATNPDRPTVVAIHHPPFETGIWWMDCVGITGGEQFEGVVRQHPQVIKILSGHVHRLIQSQWGGCSLWVCPSTAESVAIDLDPGHAPAVTEEPPSFSLHAYVEGAFVSHVVPVGSGATRFPLGDRAPEFVSWVRGVQGSRVSRFA